MGPSIKYVTLFLANFDPSSLLPCHTLSHIPGPPNVRHTSQTPRFLLGLVQKTLTKALTKAPVQILSQLFAGVLSGVLSFFWKVFSGVLLVRSPFCQNARVTSES